MDEKSFVYEKCQHCGRQFFEGKLKMHLKQCTPEKPMKMKLKVEELKKRRSKSFQQKAKMKETSLPKQTSRKSDSLDRSYVSGVECHLCGRKLNPRNLEHHTEICTKMYQELQYKKQLLEKQFKSRKQYHCKKCNYEMEQEHNFCGRCGAKKQ